MKKKSESPNIYGHKNKLLPLLKRGFRNIFAKFLYQNKDKKEGKKKLRVNSTYPPFLDGVDVYQTEDIIDSQSEVVNKIKNMVGAEAFEYYRDAIERYAEFVHLLPASEDHHHKGTGGLFHHGLYVGFYALQFSKHKQFDTNEYPSVRVANKRKWHLASFLAGMCHDLGKPLSDYRVVDESGQKKWNPYSKTLIEWANENGLEKYYLHWNKSRYRKHESFSSFLTEKIISSETMEFLTTDDNRIIRYMFDVISTQVSNDNPLYQLVMDADHQSTEDDLKFKAHTDGKTNIAIPIEKYIIDSIKFLEIRDDWGDEFLETPPLIYIQEGYFITAKGLERVAKRLEEIKVPGLPWDKVALTESLLSTQLAVPYINQNAEKNNVWPLVKTGSDKSIWAVKLAEWGLVKPVEPEIIEGYAIKSNEPDNEPHQSQEKNRPKKTRKKSTEGAATTPEPQHPTENVEQEQRVNEPPIMESPPIEAYESELNNQGSGVVEEPPLSDTENKEDDVFGVTPQKDMPSEEKPSIKDEQKEICDFFVHAMKSKALRRVNGETIVDWSKIENSESFKGLIQTMGEEGFLEKSTIGFTHMINSKASLVLTQKCLDVFSEIISVKEKADKGDKPKQPVKQKTQQEQSKPKNNDDVEQVFKKAIHRHKSKITNPSKGKYLLSYGVLAKRYQTSKFIKSFKEAGLINFSSEEESKINSSDEIASISVELTDKAIDLIELKPKIKPNGKGLRNTSQLKTHVSIPNDFDVSDLEPFSQKDTESVPKQNNKRKSGSDNVNQVSSIPTSEIAIDTVKKRFDGLGVAINSFNKDEMNAFELQQAMLKMGLSQSEINLINKSLNIDE